MSIKRIFRRLLWLVVGLLLGGLSVLAKAQTSSYPATPYWSYDWSGGTSAIPGAGCAASIAARNSQVSAADQATYSHFSDFGTSGGKCFATLNSTGSTIHAGNAHYHLQCLSGGTLTGTQCVVASPCIAKGGQTASSGYFNIGTSASASPLSYGCISGCGVSFSGTSPAATAMLNGVANYFAKGAYVYVGGADSACTSQSTATPYDSVPANYCGANQAGATVNGKFVCVDKTTSTVASVLPQVAGSTQSTTTVATDQATNKTTTTTTTTNPDGSQAVSTQVKDNATGAITTTTTEPTSKGDMESFCATNPNASACKEVTAGTAAAVDALYTADATNKTFSASLATFKTSVTSAGFFSAAGSFFNAGSISGTCSGLSTTLTMPFGGSITIDATPYFCGSFSASIYSAVAAGLMIAALSVAFAIAIL